MLLLHQNPLCTLADGLLTVASSSTSLPKAQDNNSINFSTVTGCTTYDNMLKDLIYEIRDHTANEITGVW